LQDVLHEKPTTENNESSAEILQKLESLMPKFCKKASRLEFLLKDEKYIKIHAGYQGTLERLKVKKTEWLLNPVSNRIALPEGSLLLALVRQVDVR